MILVDKRIVITGASSGIGLNLVDQLHKENKVIAIVRDDKKLEKLRKAYSNVSFLKADLSNINDVETLANSLIENNTNIDVLINNAASQSTPQLLDDDFSYTSIITEVQTNFTSICCLIYFLLPLLKGDTTSCIVNVNSALGLTPKASSAVYCATKGALNIFSQSLDYQLEHTNIKVLQAFMPLVDTPMTAGRGKNKMPPEKAAEYLINGIKKEVKQNNIGMVKLLRVLLRLSPGLASKILKNS